jgi:putative serine protease PepD
MTDQDDSAYYGPFGSGYGSSEAPQGGPSAGSSSGTTGGTSGDDRQPDDTDPRGLDLWFTREPVLDRGPEAPTQVLPIGGTRPDAAGPPFSAPPFSAPASPAAALFPAPAGVPPLRPRPPDQSPTLSYGPPAGPSAGRPPGPPPGPFDGPAYGAAPAGGSRPRRPLRAGAVVLVAALTALVVGPLAGYAGARLADDGATAGTPPTTSAPVPSTDPTGGPTIAQTPVPPAPSEANTVEIAKRLLPSTVTITVRAGSQGGTGSGFVLDRRGRIMTNNHVVTAGGTAGRIEVTFADGRRSAAKILGRSPSYDLAVIQVTDRSKLSPVQIGNSDATAVGETAIAIGSPLGLGGTVTEGIISAKDRPVVVAASASATPSAYLNAIQTDAPINPGNSGGPLVDAGGRVIGVNSAILSLGGGEGQSGNIGLGFSIPINQAVQIGNLLIADGKATYPVIGADVEDTTDEAGIRLTTITRGGPADDAGLRRGDVVTKIDGAEVGRVEELIVNVRTHRPGQTVTLAYDRGGSARQARVKLGSKEG